MPGKPRGRPFQKGQSGNPSGRPKSYTEFIEALKGDVADEAAKSLKSAVKAKEPWAVQLALAYCWGRPSETKQTIESLTDEELEAELERRVTARRRTGQAAGASGEESIQ